MTHRSSTVSIVAALLGLLLPAAGAQVSPITVDAGADWVHARTGLAVPPSAAGFARREMGDLSKDQLDVVVTYQQPETKTWVTVYLFHAGLVDASIWHDRALAAILAKGASDAAQAITTKFTPAGHGADSGLRTTIAVSGGNLTATSVALFAHDDWLLKVRMSSSSLSAPALDPVMARFIDALVLPAPSTLAAPARPIGPCADALPASRAKQAKTDQTYAILGMAFVQQAELDRVAERGRDAPETGHGYCRDRDSPTPHAVYREEGKAATEGYLMTIGDAGITVRVQPDAIAGMMDLKGPHYLVWLWTVDTVVGFSPFKGMPSPAQVAEMLGSKAPVFEAARSVRAARK